GQDAGPVEPAAAGHDAPDRLHQPVGGAQDGLRERVEWMQADGEHPGPQDQADAEELENNVDQELQDVLGHAVLVNCGKEAVIVASSALVWRMQDRRMNRPGGYRRA